MFPRRLGGLWPSLLLLALAGCARAPSTAQVSGKVDYNGKPLVTGMVTMVSEDGNRIDRGSIMNGRYMLSHAPVGRVRIAVNGSTEEPSPQRAAEGKARAMKSHGSNDEAGEAKVPEDRGAVPIKYSDPKTSALTFEVKPGQQTKDLNLTAEPAGTEQPAGK